MNKMSCQPSSELLGCFRLPLRGEQAWYSNFHYCIPNGKHVYHHNLGASLALVSPSSVRKPKGGRNQRTASAGKTSSFVIIFSGHSKPFPECELRVLLSACVRARARTDCRAGVARPDHKSCAENELRWRFSRLSFFFVQHRSRTKPPKEGLETREERSQVSEGSSKKRGTTKDTNDTKGKAVGGGQWAVSSGQWAVNED
jgi:hypothetical protein